MTAKTIKLRQCSRRIYFSYNTQSSPLQRPIAVLLTMMLELAAGLHTHSFTLLGIEVEIKCQTLVTMGIND